MSTTKGPREAVTPYSVKVLMLVEAGVILFLTYWLMSEYTHNTFFRSYADQVLLDPMTGYIALLVMGVGLTASTAVVLLYRLLRNAKRPLETTSMPRIRGGVEKMILGMSGGDAQSSPSIAVAAEPKVSEAPAQSASSQVTATVPVPEKSEPKKDGI